MKATTDAMETLNATSLSYLRAESIVSNVIQQENIDVRFTDLCCVSLN